MSSFVTYQDVQGPGVPGHQSQRYGFVSLQSDAGICTSLMRWAAPCWMEVLGGSSSMEQALAVGPPAETWSCPSLETVLGLPVPP